MAGFLFNGLMKGAVMTLKELQEKRGKLVHEAREALEAIKANTDDARAAELEARHDTIMGEFDKVEAMIERERKVAEAEARAAEAEEEARASRRPPMGQGVTRGQDNPGEGVTYRSAFYKMLAVRGEMSELSAEERAALRSGAQEVRIQTAGTTTAGGFTVPTELANEIIMAMAAFGPMYDPGVAREIVTSGGGLITIPTVNDTAVTAVAHTEGTALTDDGGKDVTFGQKQLNAYVFDTEFVKWSMELSQDSIFNMETLLGQLLGERLGRIANAQLTTGTGSDAPHGIATAATAGKVATSTTAITWDEIMDLEHSVDPAYRGGPQVRYMFHDTTLAAARKLKDGNGNYLWQMGNVQQGVPGTLLGYRYYINQAMASIPASASASRVMIFGDIGKYYVRKVGAPLIGAIQDKDFWPGFGVAGYIRFDGELADTAAVKHMITAAS